MGEIMTPTGMWIGAGLLAVLVAATAYGMAKGKPDSGPNEFLDRVKSWWVMIGIIGLAIVLGRTATIVLFAVISYIALKEYFSIVPTRRTDRLILLLAYLAVPVQYYWVGIAWYGVFIIFVPVYMFLGLPAAMVLRGETAGFLKAAGTLHWGLMVCVFSISHAAYLTVATDAATGEPFGVGPLVFLLIVTQFNDVAQYMSGKTFGRHKIAPKVSPNKTVEGFAGGVLATLALSVALAGFLTPLTFMQSIALGIALPVAGFLGDVTMSAIKRDIGVKDTGSLLPGHGGLLDRIDSLTFTAPLFFHALFYLHGA
ncbi:MAG TPA: phosphatidate cytidylyltransferase [Afifellaceae bacterium]|nr:phosphatidate cytidylyltransferase [Afifellaceae bacterium]